MTTDNKKSRTDLRKVRSLLELAREFGDFEDLELSNQGVSIRVKRRSGPVQTAPEQPRKKQDQPVMRPAIESLSKPTPVFEFDT